MAFQINRPDTAFSLDQSDRKQRRIIDDAHLAFIRTLPCVITGALGCEAAHIRYGDATYRKRRTGKGVKPDDSWTIPLTPAAHRAQHDRNEREWWAEQGIDPLAVAQQLYAVSGDRLAAIAIIEKARRL